MKRILQLIWSWLFGLTILLVSNLAHHDGTFVFDRDFFIILAILIIWIIATLLVIRFVKDKDFITKDGEEPTDNDFFLKNKSDIIIFCILMISILPLSVYMNTGMVPTGNIIVPIILIGLLGCIGHVIFLLNSKRRKWRKENKIKK